MYGKILFFATRFSSLYQMSQKGKKVFPLRFASFISVRIYKRGKVLFSVHISIHGNYGIDMVIKLHYKLLHIFTDEWKMNLPRNSSTFDYWREGLKIIEFLEQLKQTPNYKWKETDPK